METRNRQTGVRGQGGKGQGEKEGERSSYRTSINDPWTTGWELIVGTGGEGWKRKGRATGENWDNCNRTIKK